MKIGRNAPCPCGSGRKFKHCCIGVVRSVDALRAMKNTPPALPANRLHTEVIDIENRRIIATSNDVLFNQLKRDCPRIADAFDKMCSAQFQAFNDETCRFMATFAELLAAFPEKPYKRELYMTYLTILINATHTFIAAVELTRRGFRLQPGILIRSILESVSTVCHLVINQHHVEKLKAGQLRSTRTIASAKKVFPPLGRFYGLLSESFTHISHLHYSVSDENSIKEYRAGEDALEFNCNALRFSIWSINVVSELAFFDSLSRHNYFRKIAENAFLYEPSDAERQRTEQFLTPDGD